MSYNYTIRPHLLNEFRFGFNSQVTDNTYPEFPNGANVISNLGLQELGPFPKGSAYPVFEFDGASGLTKINGAREEALREHKYQFADNLTWIRGRHTLKFGFDVRALRLDDYESFAGSDNFGNYYFNGSFTGYDFADFLLGLPSHTEVITPARISTAMSAPTASSARTHSKSLRSYRWISACGMNMTSAVPRRQSADHQLRSL